MRRGDALGIDLRSVRKQARIAREQFIRSRSLVAQQSLTETCIRIEFEQDVR